MEILLRRDDFDGRRTFGKFFVGTNPECECLERPLAQLAVKGYPHPAIPAGRYEIQLYLSPHFSDLASGAAGRHIEVWLPHLLNVPGRSFILIHPFNEVDESLGCLGPGKQRLTSQDRIASSRVAQKHLQDQIERALKTEKVWITVENIVERIPL